MTDPSTPATPPEPGPARGRPLLWVAAGLVLVLVLAGVAFGTGLFDRWGEPVGGSSTPAPTASDVVLPTPRAYTPFDNTEAEFYREAKDAIKLPAAKAVTGFTKSQVDAALKKVRGILLAGRTSEKILYDHNTDSIVDLFARGQRSQIEGWFSDGTALIFATRVTTNWRLNPDHAIRASGKITYKSTKNSNDVRVLHVMTNFVWAYPFDGETKTSGDHLVLLHDKITWEIPLDSDVTAGDRGLWLSESVTNTYNMDCGEHELGYLKLGTPQPGVSFVLPPDPSSDFTEKGNC